MSFYADLHIHSKWSIASSSNAILEQLCIEACKKGVSVLGTGDFTHPSWLQELESKLIPAEPGLFRLKDDLERSCASLVPDSCRASVRFMLQVELSTIYKKFGKTRKIHHLVYVPDFSSAHTLKDLLSPFGTMTSDGRPTLLLDAKDLLEITLGVHPDAFLIPAHIWTPWFSILGSKTHFQSIEECYEELTPHIHAVETGLSTNPAMNWRLSSLDRFQIVSNSDAHSPSKIGRKASRFSAELSFLAIRSALATGNGFEGTIELYPEEGKYYLDGHRKCSFSCSPERTKSLHGLCPHCNKPLTIGVVHRLEELADRPEGAVRPSFKPFTSCIPLTEILSELLNVGPSTKKVAQAYNDVISSFGPELSILTVTSIADLKKAKIPRLDEAIKRMRQGKILKKPGYDGQYGIILTNASKIRYQQQ